MRAAVVIPARDEAGSIAAVVADVRAVLPDATTVVVDNGSRDATAAVARAAGALVVAEARPGYGYACRAGVDAVPGAPAYVFLDADGSMAAGDIPRLLGPIEAGAADVVCGARPSFATGAARRLMPWHQRLGNRVIATLLRALHGVHLGELGPFRAVRGTTMAALDLPGSRFAWPAELLARAARRGARITEVPVGYHERTAGRSKVGGSLRGSLLASWDIASVLVRTRVRPR